MAFRASRGDVFMSIKTTSGMTPITPDRGQGNGGPRSDCPGSTVSKHWAQSIRSYHCLLAGRLVSLQFVCTCVCFFVFCLFVMD